MLGSLPSRVSIQLRPCFDHNYDLKPKDIPLPKYSQEIISKIFTTSLTEWSVNKIENISDVSANSNYIIDADNGQEKKNFFLKIYNNSTRAAKSCEPLVYNLLTYKSNHTVKKFADGAYENDNFLIVEYIPGQELLKIVENQSTTNEQLATLARQLLSFLDECLSIKATGYGFLNIENPQPASMPQGILPKWVDFFSINISGIKKTITENGSKLDENDTKALRLIIEALEKFIKKNENYFSLTNQKLIPIDLNLKNFIVDDNQKLHAVDLESFLIGDSLLPYGELFGHVYKSPFGTQFDKLWAKWTEPQREIVHFYALLSNINVFAYQLIHAKEPIALSKSHVWGNPNNFFDLMADHYQEITKEFLSLRPATLQKLF